MKPWPDTYQRFMECMEVINPHFVDSLLDVGCGAGHYGRICQRAWPTLRYHGTDLSPFMVAVARVEAPDLSFAVADFFDNDFAASDVVLVSSTLEYTADPLRALAHALRETPGYLILHRLHLTADTEPTHVVNEPTYCGRREDKLHWNRRDVLERIKANDRQVMHTCFWGQLMSVVVNAR